MATKRSSKRSEPFYKNNLFIAVLAPLIVSVLLSLSTWIAFRAVVTVKLDALTESVHQIELNVMPKEQIENSLHSLSDRLSKDEYDLDQLRSQLHDDEVGRGKGR
jgi:hypothetical protein